MPKISPIIICATEDTQNLTSLDIKEDFVCSQNFSSTGQSKNVLLLRQWNSLYSIFSFSGKISRSSEKQIFKYCQVMSDHVLQLMSSRQDPSSFCLESKISWARLSRMHHFFCIFHLSILSPLLFAMYKHTHTQLLRYWYLIPCPVLHQSTLSLASPNVQSVAVSFSASAPPSAPTVHPSPPQSNWPSLD